jgi:hypothetical protein
MLLSRQRKLEHETLIRIAGTPTKHSSEEAKMMAKAAMDALENKKNKKNKKSGR